MDGQNGRGEGLISVGRCYSDETKLILKLPS